MTLPFTTEAFFGVFAGYNADWWPAVVALWLLAAGGLVVVTRAPGPRADRVVAAVLAALWLWGGVVYHAACFTAINPAAWGFAALFVAEGLLIAWLGLARGRLHIGTAGPAWRAVGVGLALYALAYPWLSTRLHPYPAAPTFGVPCPTGIFTVGLLATSPQPPRAALIAPLVWSLIGGSAAVVLGVTTDLVLLACAPLLVAKAIVTRRAPARSLRRG